MIVYLNGEYMPAEQATISPLDRGFLFGDGIYDVTPSYGGRMVGLQLHMERMKNGLQSIGIDNPLSDNQWQDIAMNLSEKNGGQNLGIYFQVSRGNEGRRFHGFPANTKPTVLGMVIEIAPHPEVPDRKTKSGLRVISTEDLRWRHCDIKSTALLGNVLHFQESYELQRDETIMYNSYEELTEASCSNVFIVKDGVVATPTLDHQLLPGISRHMAIESMRADGTIEVQERVVTMSEVRNADEVWITNSSKHIAPVVELDGRPVGDGLVGPIWEKAMILYEAAKYDF
jgi:D-alanine transaminase|tara:strand:- start:584 stop:1441 length:858 start_codon:yes stop_codon:yes gene_type:complete